MRAQHTWRLVGYRFEVRDPDDTADDRSAERDLNAQSLNLQYPVRDADGAAADTGIGE